MKKTKMLVWSDYCCATGFSNVMSHILRRLPKDQFDIDVVGVNYMGDPRYDHEKFPGRIWPCVSTLEKPYNDMLGRQKFFDLAMEEDYDTVFVLQDTFIASDIFPTLVKERNRKNKHFKLVYYFPIDSPPLSEWIRLSVGYADIPVAYNEYGAAFVETVLPEVYRNNLRIIYHGVDLTEFYPMSAFDGQVRNYREALCPGTGDKFLLGNINRNQPRKGIPYSLLLLAELKFILGRDDIALYLHMSHQDTGGDLTAMANQIGLREGIDFFLPPNLPSNTKEHGYAVDRLNIIYNMLDCVISTTLGEGWGLSLTEAMATKTAVMAPDHTSITDILSGSRGILIPAGDKSSQWVALPNDHGILRPIPDIEVMAQRVAYLVDNGLDHVPHKDRVENAYSWINKCLDWDLIVKDKWIEILR